MVIVLSALVMSERKVRSPQDTTAPAPHVAQAEKVAAVASPQAEQPPPAPAAPPRIWKVLFATPKAEKAEVSRRSEIKLFFNGLVEHDVVEWAFTLTPATPGAFAWPRPDQLVFTPKEALSPATHYTVSLTPTSGFRDGHEYELLEARWTFTTGTARTYREDIQPLIGTYCSQCHGPTGAAAAIPLATYREVSRYVVPSRSSESRLYTFIQERQHHINMAGPTHSTNQKLTVIKDWIDEDGAAE